jgi:hypothetical protein
MVHPNEEKVHLAVGLGLGAGLSICTSFRSSWTFLAVGP